MQCTVERVRCNTVEYTTASLRKAGVFKFLRRSVDGVVTRMNTLPTCFP